MHICQTTARVASHSQFLFDILAADMSAGASRRALLHDDSHQGQAVMV